MALTEKRLGISRRAMLLSAATIPAFAGIGQIAAAERVDAAENPSAEDAPVKNAVDAYVYLYPLVVFGRTMEVLTNVERPTWQKLSAPLNQLMSVRYNDPSNHGAPARHYRIRSAKNKSIASRRVHGILLVSIIVACLPSNRSSH
jgi:hypothetical protein